MLSVQNNETWALSQANPKTEPILPKPSHFFTKTEPLCPKDGACFSQKRSLFFAKNGASQPGRWLIFPKSVADFPKVCGWFSQKSVTDFPKIGDRFPQFDGFRAKVGGWFSAKWMVDFPDWWQVSMKLGCGLICAMLVAFLLRAGFCNPFLMCDRTAQTSFGCIYVFYKI